MSLPKLGLNSDESLIKLVSSFVGAEDNQTILESINDYLQAEIVSYYYISEGNKLRLLAHIGHPTGKEKPMHAQKWLVQKKQELLENEIIIVENIEKEQELQTTFSEFTNKSAAILIPLIFKKYLYGIMLFGYSQPIELEKQQKQIIEIIRCLINPNFIVGNIINSLQEKVVFYQKIMKDIRHDFANDLQSLSLATELLNSTELNDEQQKYLTILIQAKDKAIEKIIELKKLKKREDKYLGISLAEKEK